MCSLANCRNLRDMLLSNILLASRLGRLAGVCQGAALFILSAIQLIDGIRLGLTGLRFECFDGV